MDGSSNANCDSDEGLTCHPVVLSACRSGFYLVAFFVVNGDGESILAGGEFYELYDVWWGWC